MKKILVTRRLLKSNEERISNLWNVKLNKKDEIYSQNKLIELSEDCDGILSSIVDIIDEKVISKLSDKVKIISNFAVGFGNIDIEAAKKRNIVVTNTPDVLTDATAEIAMMLILMSARRAGEGERHLRAGEWSGWRPTHMLSSQVTGKTLGIVGMGRIGTRLARQARHGFGMQVLYSNRSRVAESVEVELDAEFCSLEEVLERSDFVSLNCPANDETRHLVNQDNIKLMRSSAHLINTARGDVVDEMALADALLRRVIAGAGLDVYEKEPEVPDSLLALDQVVLLPHMGSGTVETREAMGFRAVSNIEAFVEGRPLPDRVAIS